MGAYNELQRFFNEDLIGIARKYSYSDSNICILEGDEIKLKTKYNDVYQNLKSCNHNKDHRGYIEYAQDLVASWLFEDYIIEELKMHNIILKKAGADKNREILSSCKVSSASDCIFSFNGKNIMLEIMTDYKGYWSRYNKVDLRDNKFNKLKVQKALFLGVSIKDNKYFLLNFAQNISASYISAHKPYGWKPAFSINLNPQTFKPLNIENIVYELKKEVR